MKKNKINRDTKYFFIFTGIALLGFAIFYIYPIVRAFSMSLTDLKIGSQSHFVGIENYVKALTKDTTFYKSLGLSFSYAIFTGPFTLILSLVAAMLLNTKVKGMSIFRTIFFVPFIVPTFAVAAVFKGFFQPSSGLVNQLLSKIGIEGPGWYTTSDTAMITLIIISCWGFGVKMLIFLAALQDVPRSLYEVAELDGATGWKKFANITFPAISSAFFFNVVLTTIDCLKSFNLAFLMGNGSGYPAGSTLLFPVYLFNTSFKTPFRLGYGAALAWIFFAIILVLTGVNFLIKKLYVHEGSE